MRSSDISLSILIILIFVGMYFYNILAVGIKNIQDNWPEYRCNPMVMPFLEHLDIILEKILHIVFKTCN